MPYSWMGGKKGKTQLQHVEYTREQRKPEIAPF